MRKPDFSKSTDGLLPAIIQDVNTNKVLMQGYMNSDAWEKTHELKKVTFFSRSKNRLWTKGEESGNFLNLISIENDCDQDTLLIKVNPSGPTCHKGTDTCWNEENKNDDLGFLSQLDQIIQDRITSQDQSKSYVVQLMAKGINKVAQKVGEEAVEVVIEAKDNNEELFLNESADLLFHLMLLLRAKGNNLSDVVKILKERNK